MAHRVEEVGERRAEVIRIQAIQPLEKAHAQVPMRALQGEADYFAWCQ